jgi:hypothetical protein
MLQSFSTYITHMLENGNVSYKSHISVLNGSQTGFWLKVADNKK